MKTCVIIPAYNEAKAIGGLLNSIRRQNLEAVVIDDGSKDSTYKIASECGATVLRNEKNLGKGASLVKGFNYALDKNYDAVITMDGDGQHLAEEIPYFVRLAQYSDSHIFIGNRMNKTQNMPRMRVLTNKFMSWFISSVAKQNIPDTQCGLRLLKKEALRNIDLETSKFEIESEMLIKGARLGYKIESVPIKTVYSDEKSRIHPVVDTLRFFRFMIRELWITKP
jgi:glycosyltransferase involved in cell wall biosynthesis